MGETKVTEMIVRGNLQCYKCSRKIKKTLCKIPEIRDQTFDEKNNKVTITVVCCNPEKIRDKICSKACGLIESIEIVEKKQPKDVSSETSGKKPPKDTPDKKEGGPRPPGAGPPPAQPPTVPILVPTPVCGPPLLYPITCCPCCKGYGGPCCHGWPPLCPDGCGRPVCECRRGYSVCRWDYFNEENATGCTII